MSNQYIIQTDKLIIGGTEILFDYPIYKSIEIDDMLIVYLDFFDKVIPLEENIFGVSLTERKIKWQIEKRKYPNGGYSEMKCPFVGISYNENKLRLFNWCSTALIVDPITGKVLSEEQTK